jgi:hypothetical protein
MITTRLTSSVSVTAVGRATSAGRAGTGTTTTSSIRQSMLAHAVRACSMVLTEGSRPSRGTTRGDRH